MARAYIVLARNDLEDSLLQDLDLWPTVTDNQMEGFPKRDDVGQGGYLTFYLIDAINLAVTVDNPGGGGGASVDFAAANDHYGMSTYILDRVENTGGGAVACTAANAINIAAAIEAAASAGTPLTLAAINLLIVAELGGGSDLNGVLGNSSGTVEEILRILVGERFRVNAGAMVQNPGGNFVAASRGFFATVAPVQNLLTKPGGRASTGQWANLPLVVPAGTEDVNFQNVRPIQDTGDLHLSLLSGALSQLKAATFDWTNPAFTYGGGATPAQTLAGANIAVGGVFPAVSVYDILGNVL